MKITAHPSNQLHEDWINAIRKDAPEAEKSGKLTADQLNLAYQQNWFKILVPKQYGGGQLDLPAEVRLIEAISWADGSMGWTVTLCCGAGWFGGFLDPEMSSCVFTNPKVCLAGSGAPAGTANKLDDGSYQVSGLWNYASGALHATHFTANCYITQNEQPVINEDGSQMILPFIFDKAEVKVNAAWNYIGLLATGSHGFSIESLKADANRAFHIDPEYAIIDAPLYQYPFHQLAEATIAVNLSGMAIHFMDLCRYFFLEKSVRKSLTATRQEELNEILKNSVSLMNDTREGFYTAVDLSWKNFIDRQDTGESLEQVSTSSRSLAKTSLTLVDQLYPYCGLVAASSATEINRVWRDIHTASQHSLLTFKS